MKPTASRALNSILSQCTWTVATSRKTRGFNRLEVLKVARKNYAVKTLIAGIGGLSEEALLTRISRLLSRERVEKQCFRYLCTSSASPAIWKAVAFVTAAEVDNAVLMRQHGITRDDARNQHLRRAASYMHAHSVGLEKAWAVT